MYSFEYVLDHIHVYDNAGLFLFSADSVREAREELTLYEKSAA